MKKILIIIFTLFSVLLHSQDSYSWGPDNFSFMTTIKSLNQASAEELESYISKGVWVALDGSLSAITKLSAKDEEYLIEVSLVQGEWQDLDKVEKYSCKAIFQGDYWLNIIPERVPRQVNKEMILLNSHVLVLGKLVSYERNDGYFIPYLLVSQIRKIP